MALSIKTKEADRLAREVSRLTGESMTDAVTKSLAERLDRIKAGRKTQKNEAARILAYAKSIRHNFDCRPVTKREWDEGWGE
jgi:antitoxin VapB